jgi:uncharacterized protein with TBP-like fold DUF4468
MSAGGVMFRAHAIAVTAFLLFVAWPALAEQGDAGPVPLVFAEVIEAAGVPRDELYARAKVWFVAAFIDSKQILEVEDKTEGLLVGKGSIPYEPKMLRQMPLHGQIHFTLKVVVKDGRFRYELSNFTHRASETFVPGLGKVTQVDFGLITTSDEPPESKILYKKPKQKAWEEMKQMSNAVAIQLIASLRAGMQKNSKGSEEW